MIIGYDKGHPINAGAKGLLNETGENRPLGDLCIKKLRDKGHTVIDCSVNDNYNVDQSLEQIKAKANAQYLDVFISLHFNAYNGSADGTETFTTSTSSAKAIAKRVNDKVAAAGNFKNRGLKTANYSVLTCKAPALLLEVCFVDSKVDKAKYDAVSYEALANAICEGLTGESFKDEPKIEIPSDFDPVQYLLNNTDVIPHVNGNSSFNAKDHYERNGKKEGRTWTSDIQYLIDYPDVLNHVNECSKYTAEMHYIRHGKAEGRSYKKPVVIDKPVTTDSEVFYRVVIASVKNKDGANKIKEEAIAKGFKDAFLVAFTK